MTDSTRLDVRVAEAIEASLEATGVVTVTASAKWGFGIVGGRSTWEDVVPRALVRKPDVVVAMWGVLDAADHDADPAGYALDLDAAMDELLSSGAHVILVGMAPTHSAESGSSVSRRINQSFRTAAAEHPGMVQYWQPDSLIAPGGEPTLTVEEAGRVLRVRKADLVHYCPDGAMRLAGGVLQLLAGRWSLPSSGPGWLTGTWRSDPRYDAPSGACTSSAANAVVSRRSSTVS